MHWRVMSLAGLIGFIAAGQAGAQTVAASHPCSLLTAAQISAAVGSIGESLEGDMPGTGRGANPLRRACSWVCRVGSSLCRSARCRTRI